MLIQKEEENYAEEKFKINRHRIKSLKYYIYTIKIFYTIY